MESKKEIHGDYFNLTLFDSHPLNQSIRHHLIFKYWIRMLKEQNSYDFFLHNETVIEINF